MNQLLNFLKECGAIIVGSTAKNGQLTNDLDIWLPSNTQTSIIAAIKTFCSVTFINDLEHHSSSNGFESWASGKMFWVNNIKFDLLFSNHKPVVGGHIEINGILMPFADQFSQLLHSTVVDERNKNTKLILPEVEELKEKVFGLGICRGWQNLINEYEFGMYIPSSKRMIADLWEQQGDIVPTYLKKLYKEETITVHSL